MLRPNKCVVMMYEVCPKSNENGVKRFLEEFGERSKGEWRGTPTVQPGTRVVIDTRLCYCFSTS